MLLTKRFKVFQFVLDPRFGGPHSYIKTYTESLSEKIHSLIVTPGLGPVTDISISNLRVVHKWFYPIEVLINVVLISVKLWRIRENRIFHVHGVDNIAPIIASFVFFAPLVWHIHEETTHSKVLLGFTKLLAKIKGAQVLCVSKSSAKKLGFNEFVLASPAVDWNFWSGVSPRPRRNSDPISIALVANISVVKGIDVFFEGLKSIKRPVKVYVAGSILPSQKKYTNDLMTSAKELENLGFCKIQFLGQLKRTEVRSLMQKSDLFVLPSITEASPISVLEAMSTKLPVIASKVGSIPEMVGECQDFLLCEPGNAASIAAKIELFLKMDEESITKIVSCNRLRVVRHYSPEALASMIYETYQSVLRSVDSDD